MSIDLSAKIPNNVDLDSDPRLRRALEAWQPKYVDWWKEVGPVGYQTKEIYLRTAVDVGARGWANFDYVRARQADWLPTTADRAAVRALQTRPVTAPGEFANWIAPPLRGINGLPLDFTYVRFE